MLGIEAEDGSLRWWHQIIKITGYNFCSNAHRVRERAKILSNWENEWRLKNIIVPFLVASTEAWISLRNLDISLSLCHRHHQQWRQLQPSTISVNGPKGQMQGPSFLGFFRLYGPTLQPQNKQKIWIIKKWKTKNRQKKIL